MLAGAILQIVGLAGLSQTTTSYGIWPPQYGFQVLAGTGAGFTSIVLMLMVPYVVEAKDLRELFYLHKMRLSKI